TEEIDIDRSRAEFMKTLDKAREQAHSIDSKMDPNQASVEHEVGDRSIQESKKTDVEGNNVFTETEGTLNQKAPESERFNTPVRNPFSVPVNETSEETTLNPAIQDFASKLSQRLKSLKPIK
ncbi:uncharacterized protein METZ01_LOCUS505178, partial [marine metagenome]